MDFFGGIGRFAGDVWNDHVAPNLPGAEVPEVPIVEPYGPAGSVDGSGLGQAQQSPPVVPIQEKAVSDTLSYAEGTWDEASNSPDYTMRFGDRKGEGSLDVTKPHPLDVRGSIYGTEGVASNASGAFQFLDPTWKEMNDGQNAIMSPANQDRAVGRLIKGEGYDYNSPFAEQAPKLAGRWASIPNEEGVSNYGQPVHHSAEELGDFHKGRLEDLTAKDRMRVYRERLINK